MSPSSFQIRSERRRSTPPERTEKGVQAALLVGMAADQAVFTDFTLILTRFTLSFRPQKGLEFDETH